MQSANFPLICKHTHMYMCICEREQINNRRYGASLNINILVVLKKMSPVKISKLATSFGGRMLANAYFSGV